MCTFLPKLGCWNTWGNRVVAVSASVGGRTVRDRSKNNGAVLYEDLPNCWLWTFFSFPWNILQDDSILALTLFWVKSAFVLVPAMQFWFRWDDMRRETAHCSWGCYFGACWSLLLWTIACELYGTLFSRFWSLSVGPCHALPLWMGPVPVACWFQPCCSIFFNF